MNPAQKQRAIASLRIAIAALEDTQVVTDCRECNYFNAQGVCEYALMPPPVDFYPKDCDAWEEEIPF